MTINQLYVKMGEVSLYEMRDKLLDWKNKNGYNLKTEITDEILREMPDKFIRETYIAIKRIELKILEILSKGN